MREGELRAYAEEKGFPDSWWVAVNEVPKDDPMPLAQALIHKRSRPSDEVHVLNVSESGDPDWTALEITDPDSKPTKFTLVGKESAHKIVRLKEGGGVEELSKEELAKIEQDPSERLLPSAGVKKKKGLLGTALSAIGAVDGDTLAPGSAPPPPSAGETSPPPPPAGEPPPEAAAPEPADTAAPETPVPEAAAPEPPPTSAAPEPEPAEPEPAEVGAGTEPSRGPPPPPPDPEPASAGGREPSPEPSGRREGLLVLGTLLAVVGALSLAYVISRGGGGNSVLSAVLDDAEVIVYADLKGLSESPIAKELEKLKAAVPGIDAGPGAAALSGITGAPGLDFEAVQQALGLTPEDVLAFSFSAKGLAPGPAGELGELRFVGAIQVARELTTAQLEAAVGTAFKDAPAQPATSDFHGHALIELPPAIDEATRAEMVAAGVEFPMPPAVGFALPGGGSDLVLFGEMATLKGTLPALPGPSRGLPPALKKRFGDLPVEGVAWLAAEVPDSAREQLASMLEPAALFLGPAAPALAKLRTASVKVAGGESLQISVALTLEGEADATAVKAFLDPGGISMAKAFVQQASGGKPVPVADSLAATSAGATVTLSAVLTTADARLMMDSAAGSLAGAGAGAGDGEPPAFPGIDDGSDPPDFPGLAETGTPPGPGDVEPPPPPPPPPEPEPVAVTLIPKQSLWKYLDDGSNQRSSWRRARFDDEAWLEASGVFGYGDDGIAAKIRSGAEENDGKKHITTYFRTRFNFANAADVVEVVAHLLRDDGAVVYINGQEVGRSNMPVGTVSYRSLATRRVDGADEKRYYEIPIDPNWLIEGENLIAVEVHQQRSTSSDMRFDLSLVAKVRP